MIKLFLAPPAPSRGQLTGPPPPPASSSGVPPPPPARLGGASPPPRPSRAPPPPPSQRSLGAVPPPLPIGGAPTSLAYRRGATGDQTQRGQSSPDGRFLIIMYRKQHHKKTSVLFLGAFASVVWSLIFLFIVCKIWRSENISTKKNTPFVFHAYKIRNPSKREQQSAP